MLRSTRFAALLSLQLLVVACDSAPPPRGQGGDGGTADASIDGSAGTDPNQVLLGVKRPVSFLSTTMVDAFLDVPNDGPYAIVVGEAWDDLTVTVFADAARTMPLGSCTAHTFKTTCEVTLSKGRRYVRASTVAGGPVDGYEIVSTAAEGTAAAPVPLTAPLVDRGLEAGAVSYYVFDAETAGAVDFGVVFLDDRGGTSHFSLELHPGADFTAPPFATCTSGYYCQVSGLPMGPIGIRIALSGATAGFTLHPARTLGEGEPTNPIPLTLGVQCSGSVDRWSYSYYGLTTGSTAGSYSFDVSATVTGGSMGSVWIDAYALPTDTTPIASCGSYGVPSCVLSGLGANTTYLLKLTGSSDMHFTLLPH